MKRIFNVVLGVLPFLSTSAMSLDANSRQTAESNRDRLTDVQELGMIKLLESDKRVSKEVSDGEIICN